MHKEAGGFGVDPKASIAPSALSARPGTGSLSSAGANPRPLRMCINVFRSLASHPIPRDILHPQGVVCKTCFMPPTLCAPFIPPNKCQKTSADPGHGISLTTGQTSRAAPASCRMYKPRLTLVLGQVSRAGKVCHTAWDEGGGCYVTSRA